DQYCMIAAPARGGRLLQWDLRETAHNLLATMQRRSEPYHEKVRKGPSDDAGEVASIHDRVVFKQEGLDQCLQVDAFPRKTLMDRFYDEDVTLQQVADGTAAERGDFVDMPYQAKLRRATDKVQLQMHRDGNAWGIDLSITKAITVSAGSNEVNITYLLENLPAERPFHFGIEMNFAGLPDGADDRFFSDPAGQRLGQLGQRLDLQDARGISLTDQWMGVHVSLEMDRDSGLWTFPIQTVSQSEAGFELVHQSVCVQPHWMVVGDADGRWSVQMTLRTLQGDAARNAVQHVAEMAF
ncbi:MAG: alpha-amylase/4-alpha-glucanotransferase domain-containing protein, partial [Planctomycetota bacterium]